jgi:4-amino-4-deoxy-L-arabinose transferase-like glycosyltransferase
MRREVLIRAGLIIISLLFFSYRANQLGYSIPDEKRYIQSVKEMAEGGDWLTPHYHGRERFEKPILYYWFGSLFKSIFKKDIYGARFPSILFGSLTILVLYLLGKELFNARAGIISGLLLAASGMFYMFSRFATPDMTLIFFVTSCIYFFIKGYNIPYFSFMAFSFLTKGPVGPILIISVTLLFIISCRHRLNPERKMNIWVGLPVFLIIALPWYIFMIKAYGDLYINHIWQVETVGRVGGGINFPDLIKDAGRYVLVILFTNLVMTLFLPSAIIKAVKNGLKEKKEIIFLLSWISLVFLFFTFIGTQKGHYMLALSPALALFIGQAVSSYDAKIYEERLFNIPIVIMITVSAVSLAAILAMMNLMMKNMPWIFYFVLIVPLLLVWGWVKKKDFAAIFIVSNIILMLFLVGIAIPTLDNQPLLKIAQTIEEIHKEGEPVGVCSHVISHNRLSQYLNLRVEKANIEHKDPAAHARENKARLMDLLTMPRRVFCVVTKEDYEKYTPVSLRKKMYILKREEKWKKTNKIDFNLDLVGCFLTNKKEDFLKKVREEILLVTNKES